MKIISMKMRSQTCTRHMSTEKLTFTDIDVPGCRLAELFCLVSWRISASPGDSGHFQQHWALTGSQPAGAAAVSSHVVRVLGHLGCSWHCPPLFLTYTRKAIPTATLYSSWWMLQHHFLKWRKPGVSCMVLSGCICIAGLAIRQELISHVFLHCCWCYHGFLFSKQKQPDITVQWLLNPPHQSHQSKLLGKTTNKTPINEKWLLAKKKTKSYNLKFRIFCLL